MQSVNVKPRIYVDFNKENNKEDPKFKVGDHVRISTYKNVFAKALFQISLKNFLLLKKLKMLKNLK